MGMTWGGHEGRLRMGDKVHVEYRHTGEAADELYAVPGGCQERLRLQGGISLTSVTGGTRPKHLHSSALPVATGNPFW